MKISICIPVYEMHGKGSTYLENLFFSIKQQTYKNFEVIVSDHSANAELKNICSNWCSEFQLIYLECSHNRGNSSTNANNAIACATGAVIKIVHQDDFLYSVRCLELIVKALKRNPQAMWGACGFVHTDEEGKIYYKYWMPFYNDDILFRNTIGVPSVLFYRASDRNKEFFDERLIYMNDSELIFRLHAKYGAPIVVKETLVAIRLWPQQVSKTLVTKKLSAMETLYLIRKHPDRACLGALKEFVARVLGKRRPDLSLDR
jgi:glycosyltransferase involved in cell wall biosynthesis